MESLMTEEQGPDMESLQDDFNSLLIVASDAELRSDEVEMHSDVLVSSLEKEGWCNITTSSNLSSSTLPNKSLNENFVDGTDVPTEDTIIIRFGSEIIHDPVSDDHSIYRFNVKPPKKVFKISLDSKHAICGICLNIWHDVVTVAPCLHNFCNGCFSEWSRRSQEEHAIVLCPHCSSDVQSVGRNRLLHRIEKKIRKSESYLRRSDEELLIKSLPAINYGKKPRSKRSRLLQEEDNNGTNLACAECGTGYGEFECNQNTVHLRCHSCGGMMPSRTNIVVPQHCIGCDGPFCGAYWHSQQVARSLQNQFEVENCENHLSTCTQYFKDLVREREAIIRALHSLLKIGYVLNDTLSIGERTITRIPYLAHERNWHEQYVTERCIEQMGKTLQDVVSEWVTKLDNQEIDRTRMPLNHAEMITSETHVCNGCYDKLVSFLLYWFRISLPKDHLPRDAAEREDCWYGYACRTQNHNEDHAFKRNHVCPPTKGGVGN